jgi:hypothetical protein
MQHGNVNVKEFYAPCNTDTLCVTNTENFFYQNDATHKHIIKCTVVFDYIIYILYYIEHHGDVSLEN